MPYVRETAGPTMLDVDAHRASGEPVSNRYLRGAKLAGADLSGLVFRDCDLREADLSGCVLSKTRFTDVDVGGSSLRGLTGDDSLFETCSFKGADLSDAVLRSVRFEKCDFEDAVLDAAAFATCQITGKERGWRSAVRSSFRDCRVSPGTLCTAQMEGVTIEGGGFGYVDMRWAGLRRCRVSNTRLLGTFRSADLREADLRRAEIVGTLRGAIHDTRTAWPTPLTWLRAVTGTQAFFSLLAAYAAFMLFGGLLSCAGVIESVNSLTLPWFAAFAAVTGWPTVYAVSLFASWHEGDADPPETVSEPQPPADRPAGTAAGRG